MLTIFNRRELITLVSMEKLFHVKEVLSAAGIGHYTKTKGIAGFASNRRHGVPFVHQDSAYTYTLYVHRDDHHRAMEAIQEALR